MKTPVITKEQRAWLDAKTEDKTIIYLGIHGSHLYGLNREGSDIDFKAVYLPSTRQLVRGEALKTYNYKDDELDIELEVKSITSFLRSASSCDTNCIDLLHAPEEMGLVSSPMWEELKGLRKCMYAKNMKGIIGYIKTHSKKYTNKIDRLSEMKALLACLSTYPDNTKVSSVTHRLDIGSLKYVNLYLFVEEGEQPYLEVCGKKHLLNSSVGKLKEALQVEINRYGKRSKKGVAKGIDGKSLSHALRVLVQLKEILVTKDLKFPLQGADYIKKVKLGGVTNVEEVLNKVDTLFDECMMLLEQSDFQENVDISPMDKLVEDYYFK